MRDLALGAALLLFTGLGALLFRLRGDALFSRLTGRGATTARVVWAVLLTTFAWALDDGPDEAWQPLLPSALVLALFLGSIGAWWGSLGVRTPWEVVKHSARGLLWVAFPAALLAWFGLGSPWPLLAVGVSCGPVYLACRLLWPGYAVPAAELVWGAAFAAALLFGVALS